MVALVFVLVGLGYFALESLKTKGKLGNFICFMSKININCFR